MKRTIIFAILLITFTSCRVTRLYNLETLQIPLPAGNPALWNAFDSIYKTAYCPVDWTDKNVYLKLQQFVVIRANIPCQYKFSKLLTEYWKQH